MALVVQQALACSCGGLSVCELVEKADVILLGEVIDGGLDPGEDAWSGRPQSATLRIVEAYKGLAPDVKEVTVALLYMPGMCSPAVYRRGERTLAFLGRPAADGRLRDGACGASRFAKDAAEDIKMLQRIFSMSGTIFPDERRLRSAVKLRPIILRILFPSC